MFDPELGYDPVLRERIALLKQQVATQAGHLADLQAILTELEGEQAKEAAVPPHSNS